MEEDVGSSHPNKRLPILDLEMWVEDNQMLFSFYQKPVSSKDVILARSAFTLREKKNILLEEASRRLCCCSPELSWREKAAHLTDMNLAMLRCGHSEEFRSLITVRAVAKYRNSLKNHKAASRPMYRTRQEMQLQWEQEGGKPTKADWFCKSGATGVLNIPASKNSRLANMVQKVLTTVPATLSQSCLKVHG